MVEINQTPKRPEFRRPTGKRKFIKPTTSREAQAPLIPETLTSSAPAQTEEDSSKAYVAEVIKPLKEPTPEQITRRKAREDAQTKIDEGFPQGATKTGLGGQVRGNSTRGRG